MARIKLNTLREMNNADLGDKLAEMKADLAKMRSEQSKGTLKKHSGEIRYVRRDIARVRTILNERKAKASA
jgi:large subunit ribosomal protein L29